MLVLSTFRKLLSQVLSEPDIHTAVLATPSGNLISYASLRNTAPNKARIRVIVGLSTEVWGETGNEDEVAMAESEVECLFSFSLAYHQPFVYFDPSQFGKLLVQPIYSTGISRVGPASSAGPDLDKPKEGGDSTGSGPPPLVLLSINADESAEWSDLSLRAAELGRRLSAPLGEHGPKLFVDPPPASAGRNDRTSRVR